ncbi:MAG TPA: glycosyltransferase family 1 protein [Mucilaginibacter sp.]|nr:glycosyltransferase family 1 protein [Mucilaginibacter sp.]
MAHNSILVTFDSMKYPNSGFFSFGKSLGDGLLKLNNNRFDISFYVHKRSKEFFDNRVDQVYLSKFHKIFFLGRNKYDLFHFTDQYCRLKPQRVNGKRILTIHDLNPLHEKLKPQHKIDKYLRKLEGYIELCDRIVAISNFVAADILNYFPQAEGKIKVIYNGADKLSVMDDHFPNYKPQRPFLFTIGHVSSKKNFHVLPALLEGNDLELVISGIETPYREKIIKEAKKYKCEDRVTITGPVSEDDKAWYYKNCEAFAFPSLAEGFGLPVIEAMHFGKPVFLSKYTSLPEIGGDKAYYFDSFEAQSMQSVFTNGMNDFKQNNRATSLMNYAGQFNWDTTAQQYLALFSECLSEVNK